MAPHMCMLMAYSSRAISTISACLAKHHITPCTAGAHWNCGVNCMENNTNNTGIYKTCKTLAPSAQGCAQLWLLVSKMRLKSLFCPVETMGRHACLHRPPGAMVQIDEEALPYKPTIVWDPGP